MIRILFLIDKLVPAGTQTNLLEIIRGLDRSRFEPHVMALASGGDLFAEFKAAGVEPLILGVRRAYGLSGLRAYFFLARWMREKKIDIVQTHFLQADLIGSLAARSAGVKKIVTGRRDQGFWRTGRQLFLNRRLNRFADRILANACAVQLAVSVQERVPAEKIQVIYNGVVPAEPNSLIREKIRREFGIEPHEKVIGVVANMRHHVKGHRDFLKAAEIVLKKDPAARFLLVGDGPLRNLFEAEVRRLGLENAVVFAGARRDVAEVIQAMDIGCSPSHSEGLSNALLEIMGQGKPAVATNVGGNPEIVADETGFLVPPCNPEAMAEKILYLLRNDEIRILAGAAAKRHILAVFSMEKMISKYQDFYAALLKESSHKKRGSFLKEKSNAFKNPEKRKASVRTVKPGTRVCHLIWALEPGGAERQVITIASWQKEHGLSPSVVCLTRKGILAGELEAQGIPVELFAKKKGIDLSILWKLADWLKKNKIEILHTHVPTANLWGRMAAFFVPGCKVLVTEHSDLAAVHPVFRKINRLLYFRTDAYIVVSGHIRDLMMKAGIRGRKIYVVHNGIPLDQENSSQAAELIRENLGVEKQHLLIGTVGRLEPRKDHAMLLDAAAIVKKHSGHARFVIVGDGPLRAELEKKSTELGLEKILFFAGVRQNPGEWLKAMDIFVLSSITEGVSISLLEAMAAGKCCVVTDVGGNPEVIENGRTGVLIPARNAASLAQALLELSDRPEKRKVYQNNARHEVEDRFSVRAMMEKLDRIYAVALKVSAEKGEKLEELVLSGRV